MKSIKHFKQKLQLKTLKVYSIARDTTLKNLKYPFIILQNSDVATGPGEHFTLWYGKNSRAPLIFFDSYGRSYSEYGFTTPIQARRVQENSGTFQHDSSKKCGLFCLFVAYYLLLGYKYEQILQKFCKVDLRHNDKMLLKFYNKFCHLIQTSGSKRNFCFSNKIML